MMQSGFRIVFYNCRRGLASASGGTAVNLVSKAGGGGGGKRRLVVFALAAFGVGSGVGGLLAYKDHLKVQDARRAIPNSPEYDTGYLLAEAPQVPVSRSIRFPTDSSGLKITLYQYQTCPFSCKVRAILSYLKLSHDIVEVNPVLRTQLKWSKKYKKVPILVVETPDGKVLQLNDSSMITSALCSFLNAKQAGALPGGSDHVGDELINIIKCYPTIEFKDDEGNAKTDIQNKYFLMYDGLRDGKAEDAARAEILEERKWRAWADKVYVHTLSPNIYRTMSEALESFDYFDKVGEWEKHFSLWERYLVMYVGAAAMWIIGKRLTKRHNLKPDVRQSLYEESNFWMQHIKKRGRGKFMGGQQPNLADLAMYGVLSSIEGCEAFKDLDQNSRIVKDWYRQVEKYVLANQS